MLHVVSSALIPDDNRPPKDDISSFMNPRQFWFAIASLPASLLLAAAISNPRLAAQPPAEDLRDTLLKQGISAERIAGVDARGIPLVCGYTGEAKSAGATKDPAPDASGLPGNARCWETIPGVVRNDGVSTFVLEVDANTTVNRVTLQLFNRFVSDSGQTTVVLCDDGEARDRVAGDFIFTSEPLRYNTNIALQPFFANDSNSPAGLACLSLGYLNIIELSGQTNEFLIPPMVGVLSATLPLVPGMALGSNVIVTPHLINVSTTQRMTQSALHGLGVGLTSLTRSIYAVLPDAFDMFLLFSTDHVEALPRTAANNFNLGMHFSVQANYSGTGRSPFTNTAVYGSKGRLLSLNLMDTLDRGILSQNATHELTHQWAAYMSSSLGIKEDGAHYGSRCSAASLVGGFQFVDNGDGTFTLNCEEGRNRAHHAPPLDKYLMGLLDAAAVPPLYVYSATNPLPLRLCDQLIPGIERTITIQEIQELHGLRQPGPAQAQRHFALAFVAESHARLLTPVELTFYDTLAAHYTKDIPPEAPAPHVAANWASMVRYFGEGTTWTSHLAPVLEPRLTSIEHLSGGIQFLSVGFPSLTYALQASTNLTTWTTLTNQLAGTNGVLAHVETQPVQSQQFYRWTWP